MSESGTAEPSPKEPGRTRTPLTPDPTTLAIIEREQRMVSCVNKVLSGCCGYPIALGIVVTCAWVLRTVLTFIQDVFKAIF